MPQDNQTPEEGVDFSHFSIEREESSDNALTPATADKSTKYGLIGIILGIGIILAVMVALWIMIQPGTGRIPSNLPLPGSVNLPGSAVKAGPQNQIQKR